VIYQDWKLIMNLIRSDQHVIADDEEGNAGLFLGNWVGCGHAIMRINSSESIEVRKVSD
jgi:hypothetical protein